MLCHLINIHENIAFIRFIASYPNFQIILTALTLYNFTSSVICIWYVIGMLFICIATLKVLNSAVWTASPAPRPFLKEPCVVNTVNCVFAHLYYLLFSVSISISALKRLKRLLDLHMIDIQQQFTSVFFDLTATINLCISISLQKQNSNQNAVWLWRRWRSWMFRLMGNHFNYIL